MCLITFRRCRYSAELDRKWELIGGAVLSLERMQSGVGESARGAQDGRGLVIGAEIS